MPERITDKAWRQIVAVAGARGTRGKVFHMSTATLNAIARERGRPLPAPTLYSVFIVLDDELPDGEITLEDR